MASKDRFHGRSGDPAEKPLEEGSRRRVKPAAPAEEYPGSVRAARTPAAPPVGEPVTKKSAAHVAPEKDSGPDPDTEPDNDVEGMYDVEELSDTELLERRPEIDRC